MGIGAGVAAAGVVGSIASSAIGSGAASSAADKQAASSQQALAFQQQQAALEQQNTQPFIQQGTNALARQSDMLDGFQDAIHPYQDALNKATPGDMTQASLEATPGYQFTLSQGLRAAQSSAAARGLGVSGAALRGAADYATGLSDQTYNTRFNQQQTQYTDASNNLTQALGAQKQQYDQISTPILVGENAAVGAGNTGQTGATNAGNIATGSGNAQAASTIAGGNALAGGVNSASNALNQYYQQQQLKNLLAGSGSQYGGATPVNASGDGIGTGLIY